MYLSYKRNTKSIFLILQLIIFTFSIFRFTYFNKPALVINDNNYIVNEKYSSYVILEKEGIKYIYYNKDLQKGNEVLINGKIESLDLHNDFNKYLKTQNIFYIIKGDVIYNNGKQIFSNKIISKLLENKDAFNKNILKLILFNQKDDTNSEFYEMFEMFSITFMLVISGFHINLLFKILEKTKVVKYLVVFFYLYLLDFAISSYKAFLYYILKKLKTHIDIPFNNSDLLSMIMIVFLFLQPSFIFNMGFIYSFGFSFLLDIINNTITRKNIKNSILKKLIIFACSIPIMVNNNYQINTNSLLINLLFSVPISVLFVFSFLYLFLDKFYLLYKIYVYLMIEVLNIFAKFSKTLIMGELSYIILILLYMFVLIFIYCYQNKLFKHVCLSMILYANILIIHYYQPYLDPSVYIDFVDVGQGDCTIIKIKNSKKVIMIDTGGNLYSDIANNKVIPHLHRNGIEEIDTLIISHGDYDHMGASFSLVNSFKINNVIFNKGEYNDLELQLVKLLNTKNINIYNSDSSLTFDDFKMKFLSYKDYGNENDNSIVLYININGVDIVLMGDASKIVEEDIQKKYQLENIDILKVAHHGSNTSSNSTFINALNPKYSIISVGTNNKYGHPSKDVVDNLSTTKIYRTDIDGTIRFIINKRFIEIKSI